MTTLFAIKGKCKIVECSLEKAINFMYAYIDGKLSVKCPTHVVVEAGGVQAVDVAEGAEADVLQSPRIEQERRALVGEGASEAAALDHAQAVIVHQLPRTEAFNACGGGWRGRPLRRALGRPPDRQIDRRDQRLEIGVARLQPQRTGNQRHAVPPVGRRSAAQR